MKRDILELVSELTLEEKAGLCSGKDFWRTKAVERLGIPSVMLTDGPHGLRKQAGETDHLGLNQSVPATCFPPACLSAASFDTALLEKIGAAIGGECRKEDVCVILGPGVNIKRSPLCGRNFEYFSEDPHHAGEMAAAYISGVQSMNVGTSLKHFAANNQETQRMTIDTIADERTLREIYLAAFEKAVRQAQPYTVMCSYNRLNGTYTSEHPWLLNTVLRDEWGFEGYVVSDWGAVNDRAAGLIAGMDLEMPYSGGDNDRAIVEAVQNGSLPESVLDKAVARILTITFKYLDGRIDAVCDLDAHHRLAVDAAAQSAVLLKNEGAMLPLDAAKKTALIGGFAKHLRYQGGGSSHINPTRTVSALEACAALGYPIAYAMGFPHDQDQYDENAAQEAIALSKQSDQVVIFAGLPESWDSEGFDRKHLRLPDCQLRLINEIAAINPNVAVVLHNGSALELPFDGQVKAILEMYLGGQGGGEASVRLLFGLDNPCGKLPESFPLRLEDTPSHLSFPGAGGEVRYDEGLFVGYRYYEKRAMPVRYPFGHGLSYTSFAYSHLTVSADKVTVDVENTGKVFGRETVQLYIGDLTGEAIRPLKELKAFQKVALEPGEKKTVTFTLDQRSFAYYNVQIGDWHAPSGAYEVSVGASSADIRLTGRVQLTALKPLPFTVTMNTSLKKLMDDPRTAQAAGEIASRILSAFGQGTDMQGLAESLLEMPLRGLTLLGGMPRTQVEGMIAQLNALINR